MRALIDTNVLLDVLAGREPFAAESAIVWAAIETDRIDGLVCADSFTTLHYLLRRTQDARAASHGIKLVLDLFEIISVDRQIIARAAESTLTDFEDALQHESALAGHADCIVTRDGRGFKKAKVKIFTPATLIKSLK